MKALPKLSKAQQEAWARILEWHATNPEGTRFYAGGVAKWKDNTLTSVVASDSTLQALREKGMLVRAERPRISSKPHYAIHPDYLPASEPEEPAGGTELSEGLTNAIRAIWERNFEMVDMGEAALAAGMIERERAKFDNHPTFETIGNEVRADWKARNSEPAAAPEEPADVTPDAEYWNNLTPAQRYDLWNLNDVHGIWSHQLVSEMFDRLTSEYPGLIQSDGVHFWLTEAASKMVERYGTEADGSFKREPAAPEEPADGKFAKGQRVYLPANKAFKDTKEPAYGTVQHVENYINSAGKPFQRVWVQFDNIKRGLMEVHPDFLIVSAEPADDARPTLDAERAEVLDAMMASYDERIAALEMENAALETALDLERNENAKLQEKLAAEIKNADHWADMYKRLKKHGYLKFDEQD